MTITPILAILIYNVINQNHNNDRPFIKYRPFINFHCDTLQLVDKMLI